MRRPCCVICQVELQCAKNDVGVLFMDADGKPDVLYAADLYRCPSCDHHALLGFGSKAIAESWQAGFASAIMAYRDYLYHVWTTPEARDAAQKVRDAG